MTDDNTERGDIPDVRNDAASEGGRGDEEEGNPATDAPHSTRPADARPISPTDETETTEETTTETTERTVEED